MYVVVLVYMHVDLATSVVNEWIHVHSLLMSNLHPRKGLIPKSIGKAMKMKMKMKKLNMNCLLSFLRILHYSHVIDEECIGYVFIAIEK